MKKKERRKREEKMRLSQFQLQILQALSLASFVASFLITLCTIEILALALVHCNTTHTPIDTSKMEIMKTLVEYFSVSRGVESI